MQTFKWAFLLLAMQAEATTFFIPDADTAALVALVSNTASTVTNTMKILEVAKETSDQIDKYNFLAMRRYFVARRIEQHVRDIAELKKMKPKDLQELNQVLLRLKLNLQGLKSNIDFMARDLFEADDFTARYWEKVTNSSYDESEAHEQELMSASEGAMSKHVQNTAMNTALSAKILAKSRSDNLEYQKIDIALKKDEATERLRSEEFYRQWLGIESDNKAGI
ncbi:MAG: hypothetical protein A2504_17035 [Bdellovibrionales bacterium RIFOXYD12_FULL_39_22]|nr:MAG: hypothetical protein A2385_17860 [Bdellovibrionales bacterium RIFOXYB1_FULL_39_21]OFZ44039.1 MAG: hypothetical protein A2485_14995 [Bdellovibrionales bacterium RIFOXYC12_FULL_39_17]OFZ48292.1 MAG: hypothetical protein A2404_08725 [Bdellovibrionales bacterium RIFOXYC1_FULL_39_130]OFZ73037.1 MAG: hypothetical protein A2451_12710 [Bdellovibrionales bacterium RIFOXYC2_FULL_39_8]OFZ76620.1 MAG: hypothetical protein A2560_17805 [Bdellovibrionales bacterium RIFOXYD1_FULL_39_84]OFZ95541.1 MAG: